MKMMFVSDLHIDINAYVLGIEEERLEDVMIKKMKKENVDVILIGGDTYNRSEKALAFNERVKEETGVDVLYVPGNHDLAGVDRRKVEIPGLANETLDRMKDHPSSLIGNPYELGDNKVLVGVLGWYDYSFMRWKVSDKEHESNKKKYWYDWDFVQFKETDRELAEKSIEELEKVLKEYEGYEVGVMTHFVPFEEFVIEKAGDKVWNKCNAFIGSKWLGEKMKEYGVSKAFFGHAHGNPGRDSVDGIDVYFNPFGYVGEWSSEYVEEEIDKKFMVFEW